MNWLRGRTGDWRMDRLLQYRAAASVPGRSTAGGGLACRPACGYERIRSDGVVRGNRTGQQNSVIG